jgi:hypothetical protein
LRTRTATLQEWRGLPKVAIAERYEFVRHRYADMTITITWDSYRECRNCEGKGQIGRYICNQCSWRGEVLTDYREMRVSNIAAFLNEARGEARRAEEERKRRWGFLRRPYLRVLAWTTGTVK